MPLFLDFRAVENLNSRRAMLVTQKLSQPRRNVRGVSNTRWSTDFTLGGSAAPAVAPVARERSSAGRRRSRRPRPARLGPRAQATIQIRKPRSASAAPTGPVEVQPSPSRMAMPPRNGPSALAVLNAEWLSAAASACASPATSISRVCRMAPSETLAPIAKTSAASSQGLPAASGNTSSATAENSRMHARRRHQRAVGEARHEQIAERGCRCRTPPGKTE